MSVNERKFGIELEIVGRSVDMTGVAGGSYGSWGASAVLLAEALRQAGIKMANNSKDGWLIKSDCSIRSGAKSCGFEVVSPPMSGPKGYADLRKVVGVLNDLKCRVNKSCGTHVHVDASGLSGHEIVAVAARYTALEKNIDKFIDPSRRGNKNHFCKGYKDELNYITKNAIAAKNNKSKLRNAIHSDKYLKVNLGAYQAHGTIEFRHHHGCLDADQLEAWVKFCVNFVERTQTMMSRFEIKKNKKKKVKTPLQTVNFNKIPAKYRGPCKKFLTKLQRNNHWWKDTMAAQLNNAMTRAEKNALGIRRNCWNERSDVQRKLVSIVRELNKQLKDSPYSVYIGQGYYSEIRLDGWTSTGANGDYEADISYAFPSFSKDCPLRGLRGNARTGFKKAANQ